MSKTRKDELYDNIRQRVLTMEFEPGAALDETSLGEESGLSRTPVREVLRLLAGEGYVIIRQNRGTFVSPMTHRTLRSFFRTAPPIYATIAALAVENHRPEQLEALRATQAQFAAAVAAGDAFAMGTHNYDFHLIIGQMADNPYLLPSLQRLLIDHARIGQTFYRPRDEAMRTRMSIACRHHDDFIGAIVGNDPEWARRLAVEHWELSRHDMALFVHPDPLDIALDEVPSSA